MPPKKKPKRVLRRTLLVTGEGAAEVKFVEHLRATYTRDRVGHSVSVKDAGGKGASNVVTSAIRNQKNVPHDVACAVLDTDAGWDESVAARARRAGIHVIQACPCLEALLLDIFGCCRSGTSAEHKAAFAARFGGAAHDDGLIPKFFTREVLDAARERVAALDQLLKLMGV